MSIKTFTVLTESQKGAANGLAELNSSGNVPSAQLPSYVDDVIEGTVNSNNTVFTDSDGKTVTPESGKIYVDTTTNKSYRWSGTQYIVIASDLALGETDSTAYAGNKGKALADKIGTNDISSIAPTVTEAITNLNTDKLNRTGDSKDNTATFTSSDVADGSSTAWTSVPALTSGEKHTSMFSKMSQMFKNIRYLYKMLGTTDISAIGDGTATGAISSLNSNLGNYITLDDLSRVTYFTPTSDYGDVEDFGSKIVGNIIVVTCRVTLTKDIPAFNAIVNNLPDNWVSTRYGSKAFIVNGSDITLLATSQYNSKSITVWKGLTAGKIVDIHFLGVVKFK